jgi:AcrR family transcriptional regulator
MKAPKKRHFRARHRKPVRPGVSAPTARAQARRLPGRPRTDGRPPITRLQVLAAAASLIAQRGFGDTSIRMIADALNATASSIFHHFPTKDLILDELVSELFRAERDFVHQVVTADLPPDVALYKLIFEDLLVGAADNLVVQRIFLLPDLRSGRFPLASEHWNELITAYTNTIAIGQKRGVFVACDRRAAAEGLFTLLSAPLVGFTSASRPSAPTLAATLADIGVRGLLKDPKRISAVAREAAAVRIVMQPFEFR